MRGIDGGAFENRGAPSVAATLVGNSVRRSGHCLRQEVGFAKLPSSEGVEAGPHYWSMPAEVSQAGGSLLRKFGGRLHEQRACSRRCSVRRE